MSNVKIDKIIDLVFDTPEKRATLLTITSGKDYDDYVKERNANGVTKLYSETEYEKLKAFLNVTLILEIAELI